MALNLEIFDTFIHRNRKDMISIFDSNIDNVSLRLIIPKLNILLTINHTGSIKIGIGNDNVEIINQKLNSGYEKFYEVLGEFRNSIK